MILHGFQKNKPPHYVASSIVRSSTKPVRYYSHSSTNRYSFSLLTGDTNLKNNDYRDAFKAHYQKYLNEVTFFYVPHHGSKNNWHKDVFKLTPNVHMWITSARIKNQHHPHEEVLKSFVLAGEQLHLVHENRGVQIDHDLNHPFDSYHEISFT